MVPTYSTLRALRPACIGTETLCMRAIGPKFSATDAGSRLVVPDYQRGHVWTDAQAGRFMGFLLEWGTPPVIFVQRWADTSRSDEVVDGQQRLTAIRRWCANEIPAIFADPSQPPMFLRDFSEADRQILTGYGGPTLTIQYVGYTTRAEVMAFYLRLNTGGTPHSADEIERVRGMIAAESFGP